MSPSIEAKTKGATQMSDHELRELADDLVNRLVSLAEHYENNRPIQTVRYLDTVTSDAMRLRDEVLRRTAQS